MSIKSVLGYTGIGIGAGSATAGVGTGGDPTAMAASGIFLGLSAGAGRTAVLASRRLEKEFGSSVLNKNTIQNLSEKGTVGQRSLATAVTMGKEGAKAINHEIVDPTKKFVRNLKDKNFQDIDSKQIGGAALSTIGAVDAAHFVGAIAAGSPLGAIGAVASFSAAKFAYVGGLATKELSDSLKEVGISRHKYIPKFVDHNKKELAQISKNTLLGSFEWIKTGSIKETATSAYKSGDLQNMKELISPVGRKDIRGLSGTPVLNENHIYHSGSYSRRNELMKGFTQNKITKPTLMI